MINVCYNKGVYHEVKQKQVKYVLKSMTGYGRCEIVADGKKISAELRSVNHRYSDFGIKTPRYYSFLEERIRTLLSRKISRGKVDFYLNIENFGTSDKEIRVNEQLAENYLSALGELRDRFGLRDDISVMSVARYNDIFEIRQKEEDEETVWRQVLPAIEGAVDAFLAMRIREGERIEKDLRERITYMKSLAEEIDRRSPETIREYECRLRTRITELLENREIDDARILTEVAIFADKIDVQEEMVRLRSHFDEFDTILLQNEPAGRKLDFLIQEINREINTTGSKASDLTIAKQVVQLKAEVEKLREQVQNIE